MKLKTIGFFTLAATVVFSIGWFSSSLRFEGHSSPSEVVAMMWVNYAGHLYEQPGVVRSDAEVAQRLMATFVAQTLYLSESDSGIGKDMIRAELSREALRVHQSGSTISTEAASPERVEKANRVIDCYARAAWVPFKECQ